MEVPFYRINNAVLDKTKKNFTSEFFLDASIAGILKERQILWQGLISNYAGNGLL